MSLPLKVRLSLYHQKAILTVRWWFRLPIDEARERQRESLDRQFAETLRTQTAILSQLNARLHWYETRSPMLRKEYKAFVVHQRKLIKAEQARQEEFKKLVAEGMPEQIAQAQVWPPRPILVKPEADDVDETPETDQAETSG